MTKGYIVGNTVHMHAVLAIGNGDVVILELKTDMTTSDTVTIELHR